MYSCVSTCTLIFMREFDKFNSLILTTRHMHLTHISPSQDQVRELQTTWHAHEHIHIHTHAHTHTHTHTRTHTHTLTHTNTNSHERTHAYKRIHMPTHTQEKALGPQNMRIILTSTDCLWEMRSPRYGYCVCAYMCVYIHVYMYVCVCVCVCAQIYICTFVCVRACLCACA